MLMALLQTISTLVLKRPKIHYNDSLGSRVQGFIGLQTISGPGIYLSELVRDFQNFVCPGPVRDFQISGSWSGLVKILLALRPDWTEPLGPGPIGFGPWIPGQLEDRAKSNEFSFMISECP